MVCPVLPLTISSATGQCVPPAESHRSDHRVWACRRPQGVGVSKTTEHGRVEDHRAWACRRPQDVGVSKTTGHGHVKDHRVWACRRPQGVGMSKTTGCGHVEDHRGLPMPSSQWPLRPWPAWRALVTILLRTWGIRMPSTTSYQPQSSRGMLFCY